MEKARKSFAKQQGWHYRRKEHGFKEEVGVDLNVMEQMELGTD